LIVLSTSTVSTLEHPSVAGLEVDRTMDVQALPPAGLRTAIGMSEPSIP